MPRPRSRNSPIAPKFSAQDRLNAGLLVVRENFGAPGWRSTSAVCAAMVVYFFWYWFASFGDRLAGDTGDSRFIIVILEHWRDVFLGRAAFRDPPFYYPTPGTLGYSEPFFLHSLPYFVFRAIGADRYVAFHLMQVALHVTGYWAALALLDRTLFPRSWAAVAGAFLFTASAIQVSATVHAQMAIVAVLPIVMVLALRAIERRGTPAGIASMAGAGLLSALVAFSSFYIAFFFALAVIVTALIRVLLGAGDPPGLRAWAKSLAGLWREWVAGIAAAAAGLIPVLLTYLPALRESGGRTSAETLAFLGQPLQWLNPGYSNLWNRVFRDAFGPEMSFQFGERLGFPWGTLALFALSLLIARRWGGRPLLALGLSSLLLLALATRYGSFSPWFWIADLLPGGKGIRVPGRISTVVLPMMIPVCLTGLLWLNALMGNAARIVMPVVLVLWIGEQTRLSLTTLSLREEQAKFSVVPAPPPACKAFYVTGGDGPHPLYVNIDAMLISSQYRIPTLNGYSGIAPRGWTGIDMGAGYAERMERWASERGVTGVCSYDFASRQWSLKLR